MGLNWTLAVIFGGIGTAGSLLALIVTVRQIQTGIRYRYFYLSTLVWICVCLGNLFWTLSFLFLDPLIIQLSIFCLSINGFILLVKSDCISREFVDPVKLVIYVLVAAVETFLVLTTPNLSFVTEFANGETGIGTDINSVAMLAFFIMFLLPGCVYVVNVVHMNQQAPKNLKKYSRLFLGGISLMILGYAIVLMSVGSTWAPGLQMLCVGLGASMMAITIAEHPKLAFILPLKALRITAIDLNSGIPLFQHTWDVAGKLGNEDLYAGMLQGVNLILKESLQRGDVQEIKMAQATLLAYRNPNFPVACVIVATKTSRTLRDALTLFSNKFYSKFSQFFANPSFVDNFAPAAALVEQCFPFVPEYD